MAIKAEDVRKVSFDQAKRGYDTEQVDAFLEEVEQAFEIYESRSGSVSSGAPASRSSSASRERDLARRQDDIAKALIVAQQAASQVLDEANEKATNIVAEARSRAEKMLTDAREKAENLRMKAEAEQYAIVERNRAKKAQLEAASAQAQLYADEIKQGLMAKISDMQLEVERIFTIEVPDITTEDYMIEHAPASEKEPVELSDEPEAHRVKHRGEQRKSDYSKAAKNIKSADADLDSLLDDIVDED